MRFLQRLRFAGRPAQRRPHPVGQASQVVRKVLYRKTKSLSEKLYQAYLTAGVERWREYRDQLTPLARKPVLFIALNEEIAALDVSAFKTPRLPKKQGDTDAQAFTYEGYDIITLEKMIEREYSIPAVQTAQEVIAYYAKRIASDLKLPTQFAARVPKVRESLKTYAFGAPVDLDDPAMVKAIAHPVAQHVTVKAFLAALREAILEAQTPILTDAGRALSTTPDFPWSRPTAQASKTIFNLVAADNEFEKTFALFLEKAPDVPRFTKLPATFGFSIAYTDTAANLRYYEPDFVAVTADGIHHLIETKGRVDVDVAHKNRAAYLWCENTTLLTETAWDFKIVHQAEFESLRPQDFEDLIALELVEFAS